MDPSQLMTIFGAPKTPLETAQADVSETGAALKGPGGPFDDMIPATIQDPKTGQQEPARLSPGEFVLPQPVVSFLGDGDVDIGASLLDVMRNSPEALTEIKSVLSKYL